MRKNALLITYEKYQDHEVIYPYYRIQEDNFNVTLMSNISNGRVFGILGAYMNSDVSINELSDKTKYDQYLQEYDVLIIPGGVKALEKLRLEKDVVRFVRDWDKLKKTIFCICNGAQLLITANITRGRKLTGYYSIEADITNSGATYSRDGVVVDQNIISSPHYKYMGEWMKTALDVHYKRCKLQNIEKVIKKPWGYEYKFYSNNNVALWLLKINKNQQTSLHCHPEKITFLLCLQGKINVNFLSDSKELKSNEKISIRNKLFHSSKSLEDDTYVLEIETPNNKTDLVRMNDNYGREDDMYESQTIDIKDEHIKYSDLKSDEKFLDYNFKIIDLKNLDDINLFDNNAIGIFVKGGVYKLYNNEKKYINSVGDTTHISKLKNIYSKINNLEFDTNTQIMIIKK
jgi:protease I